MSNAIAEPLDPVTIGYKIKMQSKRFGNATLGRIETSLNTTESGYRLEVVTRFQGMATIISGSNLRESCEFTVQDDRIVSQHYEGGRIKPSEHLDLLQKAGFTQVDCLKKFEISIDEPTTANNYACFKAVKF